VETVQDAAAEFLFKLSVNYVTL